jgi:hypothetical protein
LKVVHLKKIIFTILLSTFALSVSANADCIKNKFGNVVCGKGQCETDVSGKILCADIGGGAIRDQHGNVLCGVGNCAKDLSGHVWCSKEPGGGAAVDAYGKVKCLSGCDEGASTLCKEAQ